METYILKTIACSSILIAFYYLFLSKEKSFQFNRFYLLFALLFSYIMPLMSLKLPAKEDLKAEVLFQNEPAETILLAPEPVTAEINWQIIFLLVYLIIVLFLLAKSIYSMVKIFRLKGEKGVYKNLKVKILEDQIAPFSFLADCI